MRAALQLQGRRWAVRITRPSAGFAQAEVVAAVEAGPTVSAACLASRMSRRTYYRWLPRWRTLGETGPGYLERVRVVESVVRYEIAEPGGPLHLDTKKLGRIGTGPGHRATRDRTSRNRASAGRSSPAARFRAWWAAMTSK